MLNVFEKDVKKVPQTIRYRLINGSITIADQEEACKSPVDAFSFAYSIKEADIGACQEAACKDPREAYWFAMYVKGADIEYCKAHMGEHLSAFERCR